MAPNPALVVLESIEGYRESFMDVELWEPQIKKVCHEGGWKCEQVHAGVAGTFPTFIVNESIVVKFFGQLFDGFTCWKVEQEAARLMKGIPRIPVAKLMAHGSLDNEPGWRYLIFEYIQGNSLGEVHDQISGEERLNLACWLGKRLAEMHSIRFQDSIELPRLGRMKMQQWLDARWNDEQKHWPTHLAAQMRNYLSVNEQFIQVNSDFLIHADITQDHLLGEFRGDRWTTRALIDFGDAMWGNLYYELAAIHMDLFDLDKDLLKAFLSAYGFPGDPDFERKAMTTSLLHQFDIYAHLFQWKKELCSVKTLEELSQQLWGEA